MRRLAGIFALLALLAACGQMELTKPPSEEREVPVEAEAPTEVPESGTLQSAVLEGEALSPDGRFLARIEGSGEDFCDMGFPPAERLEITDAKTGEVLWTGSGSYRQSILWSPESGFAAVAQTSAKHCFISVIGTESWTAWVVTLPDGSGIQTSTVLPEYEPWCVWRSEGCLDLSLGWNWKPTPQQFYQCVVWESGGGFMTGESRERTYEYLGRYDFNHDGELERVELETVWVPGKTGTGRDYSILRVLDGEAVLWEDYAAVQHAGENSLWALRLDGEFYLLQYIPGMGQGYGSYQYRIFSLDAMGEPVICRENHVEFDINFGSPMHESFDIPEIAAFLREVHGYLDGARELVNTTWGEIDLGNVDYSDTAALEEALKDFQAERTEPAG